MRTFKNNTFEKPQKKSATRSKRKRKKFKISIIERHSVSRRSQFGNSYEKFFFAVRASRVSTVIKLIKVKDRRDKFLVLSKITR